MERYEIIESKPVCAEGRMHFDIRDNGAGIGRCGKKRLRIRVMSGDGFDAKGYTEKLCKELNEGVNR
jgi:hypothetical protein